MMTFKKAGGSHEDAECNGSEFGEPSSDSGWCLCRARLARLVVVEVLMGLVLLLLLLLEEYDKTGADNDDFTFNVAT